MAAHVLQGMPLHGIWRMLQQPAPSHTAAHACCQLLQRRPRLVGVVDSTNVSITGVRLRGEGQEQASPCLLCDRRDFAGHSASVRTGRSSAGEAQAAAGSLLPPLLASCSSLRGFTVCCTVHPSPSCANAVLPILPSPADPVYWCLHVLRSRQVHVSRAEHPRRLGHPQQRR